MKDSIEDSSVPQIPDSSNNQRELLEIVSLEQEMRYLILHQGELTLLQKPLDTWPPEWKNRWKEALEEMRKNGFFNDLLRIRPMAIQSLEPDIRDNDECAEAGMASNSFCYIYLSSRLQRVDKFFNQAFKDCGPVVISYIKDPEFKKEKEAWLASQHA